MLLLLPLLVELLLLLLLWEILSTREARPWAVSTGALLRRVAEAEKG
jgi:hypothetical protein